MLRSQSTFVKGSVHASPAAASEAGGSRSRCSSARLLQGAKARIVAQDSPSQGGVEASGASPRSPPLSARSRPASGSSRGRAAGGQVGDTAAWLDAASVAATREAGLLAAVQSEIQAMESELADRLEQFQLHFENCSARIEALEQSGRSTSTIVREQLHRSPDVRDEQYQRIQNLESRLQDQLAELAGRLQPSFEGGGMLEDASLMQQRISDVRSELESGSARIQDAFKRMQAMELRLKLLEDAAEGQHAAQSGEGAVPGMSSAFHDIEGQMRRDHASLTASMEASEKKWIQCRDEVRERLRHWSAEQVPLLQKRAEEIAVKHCEAMLARREAALRESIERKVAEEWRTWTEDLEEKLLTNVGLKMTTHAQDFHSSLRDLQDREAELRLGVTALRQAVAIRSEHPEWSAPAVAGATSKDFQGLQEELKALSAKVDRSAEQANSQLRSEVARVREDSEASMEAFHGLLRESRRDLEKVQQVLDIGQLTEHLTASVAGHGSASSTRAQEQVRAPRQAKRSHKGQTSIDERIQSLTVLEEEVATEIKQLPTSFVSSSPPSRKTSTADRRSQSRTPPPVHRFQLVREALPCAGREQPAATAYAAEQSQPCSTLESRCHALEASVSTLSSKLEAEAAMRRELASKVVHSQDRGSLDDAQAELHERFEEMRRDIHGLSQKVAGLSDKDRPKEPPVSSAHVAGLSSSCSALESRCHMLEVSLSTLSSKVDSEASIRRDLSLKTARSEEMWERVNKAQGSDETTLAGVQSAIEDMKRDMRRTSQKVTELSEERAVLLHEPSRASTSQLTSVVGSCSALESRCHMLETSFSTLSSKVDAEASMRRDLSQKAARSQELLEKVCKEKGSETGSLTELQESMEDMKRDVHRLTSKVTEVSDTQASTIPLMSLTSSCSALESRYHMLEASMSNLTNKVDSEASIRRDLSLKAARSQELLESLGNDRRSNEEARMEVRTSIEEINRQMRRMSTKVGELSEKESARVGVEQDLPPTAQVSSLGRAVATLDSKYQTLEVSLAALSSKVNTESATREELLTKASASQEELASITRLRSSDDLARAELQVSVEDVKNELRQLSRKVVELSEKDRERSVVSQEQPQASLVSGLGRQCSTLDSRCQSLEGSLAALSSKVDVELSTRDDLISKAVASQELLEGMSRQRGSDELARAELQVSLEDLKREVQRVSGTVVQLAEKIRERVAQEPPQTAQASHLGKTCNDLDSRCQRLESSLAALSSKVNEEASREHGIAEDMRVATQAALQDMQREIACLSQRVAECSDTDAADIARRVLAERHTSEVEDVRRDIVDVRRSLQQLAQTGESGERRLDTDGTEPVALSRDSGQSQPAARGMKAFAAELAEVRDLTAQFSVRLDRTENVCRELDVALRFDQLRRGLPLASALDSGTPSAAAPATAENSPDPRARRRQFAEDAVSPREPRCSEVVQESTRGVPRGRYRELVQH